VHVQRVGLPAEHALGAAQFAYDRLTGKSSAIQASVQLPDVLLTKSNVIEPSFAKYAYIP
jgi:hypothetical protein